MIALIQEFFGNNYKVIDDVPKGHMHIQVGIEDMYGSFSKLGDHIEKIGKTNLYLYDLYIGRFSVDNISMFYLCYPYRSLAYYLNENVFSNGSRYNRPS